MQRTIWKHTAQQKRMSPHFEKTPQSWSKPDPARGVCADGGGDQTQNKPTFQEEIHFSSIIISSWGKNVRRRENEVEAMPMCVRIACAEGFLLQLLPPAAELEEGPEPRPHRQTAAQPAAWQWSLAGLLFLALPFHLPADVTQPRRLLPPAFNLHL